MLDRINPPSVNVVNKITFPEAKVTQLSNGISVYGFNLGSQEVVQVDLVFDVARSKAANPLVAKSVNEFVGEATTSYAPGELNEIIDFYGGYLESSYSVDHSSVTLFSLNSKLKEVLPVFAEAVCKSIFPERELGIYLDNAKQKFLVQKEKIGFLVGRAYASAMYGEHYYGQFTEEQHFDETTVDNLNDFYSNYYTSNNCRIIISGNYDDSLLEQLETLFGTMPAGKEGKEILPIEKAVPQTIFTTKDKAIQSGLRIGRILPLRFGSEEYFQFKVLNTVLGGYFGSRLMSNIREDKGYTYGIGSNITFMKNACVFGISTEVGAAVTDSALSEVYKEISRLRTELVAADELEMVKNYMRGMLLRSSDGVFSIAQQFKSVQFNGESLEFFQNFMKTIAEVQPEDLMKLANLYLGKEELLEVVVGAKS
jgi:predicted Zn-dependent peptidase